MGSHEVADKAYIDTQNSQLASIDAIFTSTYHTKWLNLWLYSPANCVMNYSRLSAYQGEMEPFEDHPSTCGRLTSLKNKPQ